MAKPMRYEKHEVVWHFTGQTKNHTTLYFTSLDHRDRRVAHGKNDGLPDAGKNEMREYEDACATGTAVVVSHTVTEMP